MTSKSLNFVFTGKSNLISYICECITNNCLLCSRCMSLPTATSSPTSTPQPSETPTQPPTQITTLTTTTGPTGSAGGNAGALVLIGIPVIILGVIVIAYFCWRWKNSPSKCDYCYHCTQHMFSTHVICSLRMYTNI